MENLIFFKCWQNYSISYVSRHFNLSPWGGGVQKVFKFSSLKGEENLQNKKNKK